MTVNVTGCVVHVCRVLIEHHCPKTKCLCCDVCIGGSVDIGLHVTRFFFWQDYNPRCRLKDKGKN